MTADLLLRNATIIDGTGSAWFRGAVAVEAGTITSVYRGRNIAPDARQTVSLDGLTIAPGFIDAHSHADVTPFEDPWCSPKVRQGVTTEIVGQDGISMAPLSHQKIGAWDRYWRALVGEVDRDEWQWESVDEYLTAVDQARPAINIGTLVGHGTIRCNFLGFDPVNVTEADLDEMADAVEEALAEGAVGVSTGLEYYPQVLSDTGELKRLAEPLQASGKPLVAHIRSYSRDVWNALDEFIDIGAELQIPTHLSHFRLGAPYTGDHETAISIAWAARERGVDFTADLYPFVPGCSVLHALLPSWLNEGGPDAFLDRLQDAEIRDKLQTAIEDRQEGWAIPWDRVRVSHVGSTANEPLLGKTIPAIAQERGSDPLEVVIELLDEEALEVGVIIENPIEGAAADIENVMAQEFVAVGSDGIPGKHPHPRLFGTYPRMLEMAGSGGGLISLEEAIRKMTSLPARIYHLERKGLIRPGFDADLVVFDPDTVGSNATVDFPKRPPTGIEHVIVNGEFVVEAGELSDNRPGKAIRS